MIGSICRKMAGVLRGLFLGKDSSKRRAFTIVSCLAGFSFVVIFLGGVGGGIAASSGSYVQPGQPEEVKVEEEEGLPSVEALWNLDEQLQEKEDPIRFTYTAPVPFTGLSVGWGNASEAEKAETFSGEANCSSDKNSVTSLEEGKVCSCPSCSPEEYEIRVRSKPLDGEYSDWQELNPGSLAGENPSGLNWSGLYFTPEGESHRSWEVELHLPGEEEIEQVWVSAADASWQGGEDQEEEKVGVQSTEEEDELSPTSFAGGEIEIIERSEWLKDVDEDKREPSLHQIDVSHGVVHHTATANEPDNPEQVVRNIWNYHVNSLGWRDIGYNYLIDQHGNIYQGRHNEDLGVLEVHGAHARGKNFESLGVSLLGNFQDTSPPSDAVDSLEKLLAWLFNQYRLDPQESADIGNLEDIPRICGHRDVGATACPGAELYEKLPEIREEVATLMAQAEGYHSFTMGAGSEEVGSVSPEFISGNHYRDGTEIRIRAEEKVESFRFDGWEASGGTFEDRESSETVFTMPGEGAELTASFEYDRVFRISGENRYYTAVKISEEAYKPESAEVVVLARGDDFPDALAGAPLAHQGEGPLLLTTPHELPEITKREIERVLSEEGTVYLLGGTAAISEDIEEELREMQEGEHEVERLGGNNRYATAVKIAETMTNYQDSSFPVFLATGEGYADAAAISGVAGREGGTVLLTTQDSLPEETEEYLEEKEDSLEDVYVIGGEAVVGEVPYWQAGATERVFGENRYATAAQIAEEFHGYPRELIFATGRDFPDALSGGSFAASREAPVLLTASEKMSPEVADYLFERSQESEEEAGTNFFPDQGVRILGGENAVSEETVEEIKEAIKELKE